ncbi:MAG TPA: energy transducer TonB [Candidatus Angelobacter sp.]
MKTALIALLGIASMCVAQTADHQDLAGALNKHYLNQTLVLRRAVTENSQTYDSAGTLLSPAHEGPWTVCSGLKPTAIRITTDEVRIEGDRLTFAFESPQTGLAPTKTPGKNKKKNHIQIMVKLSEPLVSLEQADAVLSKVFAMTDDDVIQSVPEFWKNYLTKRTELKKAPESRKAEAENPARKKDAVFNVGNGVTAPRAIHTPEPNFSDVAKEAKYHGVVVLSAVIDETGRVLNPYITRPAGMGLDEKAIEVVQSWRFKPGMRDGQPVKVEMTLEIAFNLY